MKITLKNLIQVGPLVALLFFSSCNKEENIRLSPVEVARKELSAKGKVVYIANCVVCHNINPKLPGPTGPEIYGSSVELLTARLIKLEYPKGYRPKRDTELMPSFEELEKDIPSLHSFLNQ